MTQPVYRHSGYMVGTPLSTQGINTLPSLQPPRASLHARAGIRQAVPVTPCNQPHRPLTHPLRCHPHTVPRPRYTLACARTQVSGKLLELCSHHTASRVIQLCVKYGTDADRRAIMEQVRANILELSKSKYGHFLVRKLINTAKKEDVPGGWAGVCRTVRHMQGGFVSTTCTTRVQWGPRVGGKGGAMAWPWGLGALWVWACNAPQGRENRCGPCPCRPGS